MALPLYNYFNGAASGTTITTGNSGGGYSTAFDSVTIGTSAVVAFDNTHRIDSAGSMKISTSSTSASAYTVWTTALGTQTVAVYYRAYLYFTAFTEDINLINFMTSAPAACCSVWVNGTGQLIVNNGVPATILTFTGSLTTNAWNRIEGFFLPSTTVGQWAISMYNSPDSTTPTETHSGSSAVFGANIAQVRWGTGGGIANAGPFWMGNVALSNVPVGPASTIPVVSPSLEDVVAPNTATIGQAIARASTW